MTTDPTIAVVGATGAVGREVLAVLDRAPWRPKRVWALATLRSDVHTVPYGDESLAVDDVAEADFEELDAVILAVPPGAARDLAERAVAGGVAVVDTSGVLAEDPDVPLVVPWVNPEQLQELPPRGALAVPQAAAILLASVLGPLGRAGLTGPATATVLLPASAFGAAGIDELSRQVVALLNQGAPPRKVFPQGLAFDLLPQVGNPTADGWTDQERAVQGQLDQLLGEGARAVTLVGVPVFSGISATLQVHLGRQVPPGLVERILADGGVQLPQGDGLRQLPRPRRVEGQPFAFAARPRTDDTGTLHLWLSMDNLRATAAVAVSACGLLVRGGRPA